MVVGLQTFREHFAAFADQYVIIGGTACDVTLGDNGLTPRATRDIDIIIIVEALTGDFVRAFWEFVKAARYERQEEGSEKGRQYYRFRNPDEKGTEYPFQLELFSRKPDILQVDGEARFTPIPVDDEELSSLSAMLMDNVYYEFTIANSIIKDNIHHATANALICLKAKAFLNMADAKERGEHVDGKNILKHKGDVFRLGATLRAEDVYNLPQAIKDDLQAFIKAVQGELPTKDMFKALGAPGVKAEAVLGQLITSYKLTSNNE